MKKIKVKGMDTQNVGGAEMYPSKDIMCENAVNSKIITTLVAAVKAADLVTTLQGWRAFTVFLLPTTPAFEKLPGRHRSKFVYRCENKENTFKPFFTYSRNSGNIVSWYCQQLLKKEGKAEFTTGKRRKINRLCLDGTVVKLIDSSGTLTSVTIADVNQSKWRYSCDWLR